MEKFITGKPQLNRVVNRRLILDKIRRDRTISRAELAKQTAIRPPTVSAVVKELIEEGLVEEVGSGETRGGRAPRMIALRRDQPRALGFELSETSILAGLCDLTGSLCAQCEVPFSPLSPKETVKKLHEAGTELLSNAKMNWNELYGVGVAVQGHLNTAEGLIRWSRPFDWRNVPFKEICETTFSVPTDIVNDSLAGSMAAHLFDIEQSVENLVFLYLRFNDSSHGVVGIGVGIILNGQPFHGEFGAAGEITSVVTHPLVNPVGKGNVAFENLDVFTKALIKGDSKACSAVTQVGVEVGGLVQHIVNLLEPGVLMVGSDAPEISEILIRQFADMLEERKLPFEAGETRLMNSTLGQYGVVRGAVVPTLQRVFRMPQWS